MRIVLQYEADGRWRSIIKARSTLSHTPFMWQLWLSPFLALLMRASTHFAVGSARASYPLASNMFNVCELSRHGGPFLQCVAPETSKKAVPLNPQRYTTVVRLNQDGNSILPNLLEVNLCWRCHLQFRTQNLVTINEDKDPTPFYELCLSTSFCDTFFQTITNKR